MSELIDIYDENGKPLGAVSRKEAHAKGLWHYTVHCWILQAPEYVLFQMRAKHLNDNPGKLYTTASGHISARETLEQGFEREVREELGATIKPLKMIRKWNYIADFVCKNGEEYHDRAVAHIFIAETECELGEYRFDQQELDGIYRLNAAETLKLASGEIAEIKADAVVFEDGKYIVKNGITITADDFLTLGDETLYSKFGFVLEAAIEHFSS